MKQVKPSSGNERGDTCGKSPWLWVTRGAQCVTDVTPREPTTSVVCKSTQRKHANLTHASIVSDLCPASQVEFICIRTSVWSSAASPTWTRRRTSARSRRRNSGAISTVLRIPSFRQGAEPRGSFHGAVANRSARPVPFTSRCDHHRRRVAILNPSSSKFDVEFCFFQSDRGHAILRPRGCRETRSRDIIVIYF